LRIPERRKDLQRRRAVEEMKVWSAIIVFWKVDRSMDSKQIGPILRREGVKVTVRGQERLITDWDVQQRIKRIMGAL